MPAAAWIPAAAGVAGAIFGGEKTKSFAPSLIQGGLGLTGSILGSEAAGKAADLQAKATAEALALEKDKEAERRREYELDRIAQQRQWEARENFLNPYRKAGASVLARYGIEIPETFSDVPPEQLPMSATQGMVPPTAAPQVTIPPMGMTIGNLTSRGLYGR